MERFTSIAGPLLRRKSLKKKRKTFVRIWERRLLAPNRTESDAEENFLDQIKLESYLAEFVVRELAMRLLAF